MHWGKWLIGQAFGVSAWGLVTQAIPDWTLWSASSLWVMAAFYAVFLAIEFTQAAKLGAWPWNTRLTQESLAHG